MNKWELIRELMEKKLMTPQDPIKMAERLAERAERRAKWDKVREANKK